MRYGIYDKKDNTQLKRLWKRAFHDTDAYIEYYFQYVVSRNLIFAAWDDDRLVSMLHLNPYTLICQGAEITSHYIVGVATEPRYRKQGIMKKLLLEALHELQEMGDGFTYLMPAKEEYYYGLGFQNMEPGYIFSWQEYLALYDQPDDHNKLLNYKILDLNAATDLQWEDFNLRLSERYDLFAKRDRVYAEDLKLQCQCLSGDVYIVADQETIIAIMGIMIEGEHVECVQYITTEHSLLPMKFVAEQLEHSNFSKIEIFGSWFRERYPLLQTKSGKGIMYRILDKQFSNVICCDRMLMINEIV